jgi:FecR protein
MSTSNRQEAAFCSLGPRPRQREVSIVAIAGILCAAGVALGADLSQAVVRQKVNVVTLAPNLTGEARPAAQGAVVHDENVVRTGTESRAELEFVDLTLARLGANSIFSFDAKARAMNFTRGAVLFSKPTNSGAIQLRSGAVSGAITGSTGFISTVPIEGVGKAGRTRPNGKGTTTLVGMLEGKIHGGSRWSDSAGREHTSPFQLGPGEMLVARPDGPPRVAQFDIPRFVKTSPLIKGFKAPLPNAAALDRAIADYLSDEQHGFIDRTNILVSTQPINMALVGRVYSPLDVVAQIKNQNPGGFLPVGSSGIIRAQLIWNTTADLDLYLTLPNGQVVSFANVSVTFNNGRAIAMLDRDNIGRIIDIPPTTRVENIVVNGIPLEGLYTFIVNSFNSSNATDSFTLRVFYNGQLQIIRGSLAIGQNSVPVTVRVPHR